MGSDSPAPQKSAPAPVDQYNLDDYLKSDPDQPVTTAQRLDFYLGLARIILNPSLNFLFLLILIFCFFIIINPWSIVPGAIQSGASDALFKVIPSFVAGLFVGNKISKS
jgi:hypothetical protein